MPASPTRPHKFGDVEIAIEINLACGSLVLAPDDGRDDAVETELASGRPDCGPAH